MKAAIKKLWVEALRSGQYKQGRYALRSPENKFCCLGVLCNLHAQAHPRLASKETNPTSYMGAQGLPPAEVMRWAGLNPIGDVEVTVDGLPFYLAELNDGDGIVARPWSFKRIAKIIEEQL